VSFARLLAFETLEAGAGRARLRTIVGPEHVNMHGSAHGGFLYSLADEAFALASNSREADAVALSVTMDYFLAVFPGDILEARASEEHLGRRVATYRVEVAREREGDDGRAVYEPVALFVGTVYRRERRTGAS
jgi:acyl-CoA thioesterase